MTFFIILLNEANVINIQDSTLNIQTTSLKQELKIENQKFDSKIWFYLMTQF